MDLYDDYEDMEDLDKEEEEEEISIWSKCEQFYKTWAQTGSCSISSQW